jgi:hypothetical protein
MLVGLFKNPQDDLTCFAKNEMNKKNQKHIHIKGHYEILNEKEWNMKK